MKTSVLYYSKTGNTKRMAEFIVEGMLAVEGIQPQAFALDQINEGWVKESQCVILGTPIYMASLSGVVKSWLDTEAGKYSLAGKIGGAFATANYLHGGAEIGIQSILSHMMVFGMLAYSGGGAFGKPVIHLGPVALKDHLEESEEVFRLYGQRMAAKTLEIFK